MLLLLETNFLHLILPVAFLLVRVGWPPPLPRTHPFHRGEGGWWVMTMTMAGGVGGGPGTWNIYKYISASLPPVPPWKLSHKSSVLLPWRAPSRDQSALEFVTCTTPHAWKSFQYTCVVALPIVYVYIHYINMYTSDMYAYLCIYLRQKSLEDTNLGELFRELFQSLNMAEIYQEALDSLDVHDAM